MSRTMDINRRRLMGTALSVAGLTLVGHLPGARALQQMLTPAQSKGPFYPTQLPLDKDNDLVKVAGRSGLAKGKIANVIGRVLDERGRPVPDARIEIWQCDANGRYHHSRDQRNVPLDPHFQGYGRFVTASDGAYRFRTIKPVPYPGRAPHIHFAISGPDFDPLITQMYVEGAPENQWDFLLNRIADPQARQRLLVPFEQAVDDPNAELVGYFDIVLATGRQ